MPGGIRDIEFLVQCLQRLHGGREIWVRHGGTLFALSRVYDKNLLSASEYARLATAYEFLRHIEHRLQFYDDRQTHTLPTHPEELEVLARKMPAEIGEPLTAESLQVRLEEHLGNVREMYARVIQARKPMYYMPLAGSHDGEADERWQPLDLELPPSPPSNLTRYLAERAPQLTATLARAKLNRGRERFEVFLEKISDDGQWLARLETDSKLVEGLVDIFEHSPYFGDQLLRHPEMLADLDSAAAPGGESLREAGDAEIVDSASLRSYFRRRMFRIQADSLLGPAPIFETLERTSGLADAVIAAAYRIALQEAALPAHTAYTPAQQMMVVSLGRLGMREFDLASDADLIFVIPDQDAPQLAFWTAVAERMINVISAYTGDGVMFTVDTRLRPNGREGALVQPAAAYREYFAKHAEAWEGIAYMKARAVAGNLEGATEFLNKLQEVDWRRYGQSGRSRKELAQMRARLDKEQASRNPLKAAVGGYYDIDFALMYLRLRGAGIFYKVLNTPARIDVIEKMGHLERDDADFLRDAAVFYRAIDHGLRVATGYAGGHLPTSPSQSETLAELVRRWTPDQLHDQRLDLKLGEIRQKTREFFNRVFGV
jgi:glutamate-ammonia-ligase adenylyltransferase